MREFPASLANEFTKLKRSLALLMVIAAPCGVALLVFLLLLARGDASLAHGWPRFLAAGTAIWCYLVLPMTIAILAAAMTELEHQGHGWRRWFATTASPALMFLAKLIVLAMLLLFSTAMLALLLAGMPLIAPLLGIESPAYAFSMAATLATDLLRAFVGSLFIAVLHLALGWMVRSFVIPIGVGLVAIIGLTQAGASEYWVWHPWTWPMMAALGTDGAARRLAMFLAVAGMLLAAGVFSRCARAARFTA